MTASAPAITPQATRLRSAPPGSPVRSFQLGGPYAIATLGSILLAALSLLYAAVPGYDPWAWVIWGREIVHFQLHTVGGPTWKPLPILFTTLFAPSASGAPGLWLLVARAGGILAVGLAAALAHRLAGARARGGAWLAAALAAGGVVAIAQYVDSVGGGESEGLLLACVLLAIHLQLDGRSRHAFAFAFAAALIRPETWLFFGAYCVWLWRRDPGWRAVIAGALGLIPLLWFVPDLVGSGSLMRGVEWAQFAKADSPARAACPFCTELTGHAVPLLAAPFKVGLVMAALAVVGAGAGPRRRTLVALVGLGLAWILEEAVLTQAGFSGSDRYLLAPVALLTVAGAAGWGSLPRPRVVVAGLAATVAVAVLWPSFGPHFGRALGGLRYQQRLSRDMRDAVREAGGSRRLLACGPVQTNPSEVPLVAWTLGTQLRQAESWDGLVLIQSANGPHSGALPDVDRDSGFRLLARAGAVSVLSRCR